MDQDFEPHRARLLALAYRLLGSWAEAEDVVQEVHLTWHQQPPGEVVAPRAWLERVVTRRCLDLRKSARVQREQYVGPWLPEPVDTASARPEGVSLDLEAISLAFLALLERLSPLERAAFVLVEAFDYSPAEVAQVLSREPAAVRQLLHRARSHIQAGRPRFAPSREAHADLLTRFMGAVMSGDPQQVERLLSADATARTDGGGKSRAAINVIHGPSRVARFLIGVAQKAPPGAAFEVRELNGWPAVVAWLDGRPLSVTQLETDGEQVYVVDAVTNPDKLVGLAPPSAEA